MEYNCSLIKVDWLDACIVLRVVGAVLVSSGVGVKFAQSSSQWEARAISEEMSQILLTNKKQGNLDYVHAADIIKPTQTRINCEKNTFSVINQWSI